MFYLSAQPAEYYFTWQLEIQLYNFSSLGIKAENIHVLIGVEPAEGIPHNFVRLVERCKNMGTFYFYADKRADRCYVPSLRPHLIQQHFAAYPELQKEIFFYHDSDIIFRELPAWGDMLTGDTWYVSDTRKYLDSGYVKTKAGEEIFSAMCSIVGVDETCVIGGDEHCGGAQYLLKNTPVDFWRKVELDSTALFCLLESENDRQAEILLAEGQRKSAYKGIQAWCADMWALYWNALKCGHQVRISKELDFCWAKNAIDRWHNTSILHYTGDIPANEIGYFRKGRYTQFSPFFDAFLGRIKQDSCSFPLAKLIRAYAAEKCTGGRFDMSHVSFLVPVHVSSDSALTNLMIVVRYLARFFNAPIYIGEAGPASMVDQSQLPANCGYFFMQQNAEDYSPAVMVNFLTHQTTTPLIAIHNPDVALLPVQISAAAALVVDNTADMVIAHDGEAFSVDWLFRYFMMRDPEPEMLIQHKQKFLLAGKRSAGGCVVIDRQKYQMAGMDNSRIKTDQYVGNERLKRFSNLGYKVEIVQGPLFKLFDQHNPVQPPEMIPTMIADAEEYLKISNMRLPELTSYINTWKESLLSV